LKAIYVQNVDYNVPRIHDLLKIAKKANLDIDENTSKKLQYITLFNIETRYVDYKLDFKKKCTKKYTQENIAKILEIKKWLLKQLKN
jgi:hypothetical protein